MTLKTLALKVATADDEAERIGLIEGNQSLINSDLAILLKDVCLDSWTTSPIKAVNSARALAYLSKRAPSPEFNGYAAWTDGIACMINGQLRRAVVRFDDARREFQIIGHHHSAASTQVAKLYPLAMLGRYDEAIEAGLWARQIFFDLEDLAAAGKIEHNLGNIFQLTGRYEEAEDILRSARSRFLTLGDLRTLAQITNSTAYVLSYRYKFDEADDLYREALELAETSELVVTQAEIESNLGYFALVRGRYDRALKYLARARSSYEKLGMPLQSAIAEMEMADAYMELNLYAEAGELYRKVIPAFADSGMSIEYARSLTGFAQVRFADGESQEAYSLINRARRIYASCDSAVGVSSVLLSLAQFQFSQGEFSTALLTLRDAEVPLSDGGVKGNELRADLLRAECLLMLGRHTEAQTLLVEILESTTVTGIPHLTARCQTALGLTSSASDESAMAERYFKAAIATTEGLRSPLPLEDFRTAFFGDKQRPYLEMVRHCINSGQISEAFAYLERSRSRTLVEMIERPASGRSNDRTSDFQRQISDLRAQLNWLYNQINQPATKTGSRESINIQELQARALTKENEITALYLRQQSEEAVDPQSMTVNELLIVDEVRELIGSKTAFVEFGAIDGGLFAFVVTDSEIQLFRDLCTESEIQELVERFYFQIDCLRNNPAAVQSHMYELTLRTRKLLNRLYGKLIQPLEKSIGSRRLAITPHGSLNYIPFHALFDGFEYIVENREVVYLPSATALKGISPKADRVLKNALLVGVPDPSIPFVENEMREIAKCIPAQILSGEKAVRSTLEADSIGRDILHLACHGQFRAESPLFSSLKLADGWMTVRDVSALTLDVDLVVLSACETGISRVAPGDELLGLVRGFLSAGANSLMLSLWNVHDETTSEMMVAFYKEIANGSPPSRALRIAQNHILRTKPHPFFWSPFFFVGK
ncbi:MAG: CHAT domain-containing protein [Pyrinomonadaceae bacterium]